jgi:hypothetical protein
MKKAKIRTKAALAQKLDISRPTLDKFLALPGAPAASKGGYDLDAISEFISSSATREGTLVKTSDALRSLKCQELTLKCDKLRFELAREKAQYFPKAEVLATLTRLAETQKSMLLSKCRNELVPRLQGKGPEDRLCILDQFAIDICDVFQRGISKYEAANPPPAR